MRRIVVFSDPVDHEEDIEFIKNAAIYNDCKIDLRETTVVQNLESLATSNSVVFVDYGALSFGQFGMFDHITRYLERFIVNHPSVTFVFVLTMGKEIYEDCEVFHLSNVETIDRDEGSEHYRRYFEE
jgi:hypothetical protein